MFSIITRIILASIIPFFPIIAQNSERYGLDPILISSQVKAESSFDPKAVSRVGAIGLMQIMPSTAEWLGFEGDEELLFLPEINIRLGCYYDRWLIKFWIRQNNAEDGMLEALMLASYNAGPGRVKKEVKKHGLERFHEGIPAETRGYVKRIFRYRAEYLWITTQKLRRRCLE